MPLPQALRSTRGRTWRSRPFPLPSGLRSAETSFARSRRRLPAASSHWPGAPRDPPMSRPDSGAGRSHSARALTSGGRLVTGATPCFFTFKGQAAETRLRLRVSPGVVCAGMQAGQSETSPTEREREAGANCAWPPRRSLYWQDCRKKSLTRRETNHNISFSGFPSRLPGKAPQNAHHPHRTLSPSER